MMKRVFLFLALGLFVFGSLAVAQTAVPATPGATVGGDMVIGVSQTFKDLDPRISNSAYDSYVIGAVYDGLIILHPETLAPSPWIAKSWDIISDSQVRFYLNEGIKFHNGEDLTAEDVAFTFNWIADTANNSPNATELIWMQEAIVIDEYTVDIITKPEYTPFAPGFGTETQSIVPMDTVLAMGDDAFNLAPVGSGPFVFVEWLPGEHIKLERNEDYWLVHRITRGQQVWGPPTGPTVLVNCAELHYEEMARMYREGIHLVVVNTRQIPVQCFDPKAKVMNRLHQRLATLEAQMVDPNAYPLMLDMNGLCAEGSTYNFFMVNSGRLFTPKRDNILWGISRATVLELAKELELESAEVGLSVYDLHSADEIFLTATSYSICPVAKLNNRPLKGPIPGPVTQKLISAWSKMVGIDIVEQCVSHLRP